MVTLTRAELAELIEDAVALATERLTDSASGAPALLTQADLAKTLCVSVRTIHTLRQQGLPMLRVGDSPRFELAAVLSWLRNREQEAEAAGGSTSSAATLPQSAHDGAALSASAIQHGTPSPSNSAHLRPAGGRR